MRAWIDDAARRLASDGIEPPENGPRSSSATMSRRDAIGRGIAAALALSGARATPGLARAARADDPCRSACLKKALRGFAGSELTLIGAQIRETFSLKTVFAPALRAYYIFSSAALVGSFVADDMAECLQKDCGTATQSTPAATTAAPPPPPPPATTTAKTECDYCRQTGSFCGTCPSSPDRTICCIVPDVNSFSPCCPKTSPRSAHVSSFSFSTTNASSVNAGEPDRHDFHFGR
jgi:hypothetical protein